MSEPIDLRTDALTRPTEEISRAMDDAKFGWSAEENRGVTELEELAAELLGMESGLLVSTCSMANLIAVMSLVDRGEQVIFEESAHMVTLEEHGVASMVGAFPRLLRGTRGALEADQILEVCQASQALDLPRTALVCIENSHNNAGGTVLSPVQMEAIAYAAESVGASVHLDGARVWNAAVSLGVRPRDLTQGVTTVSASLNKGLCAPWGAVLCGAGPVIDRARRNLRRIGAASVHKQGAFAAAGIVALTTMMSQLEQDNEVAAELGRQLATVAGLEIDLATVQSNIVLVDTSTSGVPASVFVERLDRSNVLAKARVGDYQVRFVTHRHVSAVDIPVIEKAVRDALSPASSYLGV